MIRPNCELVSQFLRKWDTLENYTLQEKALGLLFNSYCSGNTQLENVLLKVTALNQFYSTNIYDTYTVAKHIVTKNIDERLRRHDRTLVNELALVTIKNKGKNFYSFASKYCSHHAPEVFPIFDSFVEKMLWTYAKEDRFDSFNRADMRCYENFVRIIASFQKFYGLENYTLRQIDIFLWLSGKEFFPKSYSKKREDN